jgi:hypothetical protein
MDWRMPIVERFYSGSGSEVTVREGEDKRTLDLRTDLLQQHTGFAWGHEGAAAEQLGLALLADALGNDARAMRLSRRFETARRMVRYSLSGRTGRQSFRLSFFQGSRV